MTWTQRAFNEVMAERAKLRVQREIEELEEQIHELEFHDCWDEFQEAALAVREQAKQRLQKQCKCTCASCGCCKEKRS